jgi:hypothetical protein
MTSSYQVNGANNLLVQSSITDPLGIQAKKVRSEGDLEVKLPKISSDAWYVLSPFRRAKCDL